MQTRKPLRLSNYDYSQNGVYFVTVCTKDKAHLLGSVVAGRVVLTACGRVVEEAVQAIPGVYPGVMLDHFVVMPNHIHLLVRLESGPPRCAAPTDAACWPARQAADEGTVGAGHWPARQTSLPKIISALKSLTTRRCGLPLWQRGYYDHIIRDETDYLTRWNYIDTNPARWDV